MDNVVSTTYQLATELLVNPAERNQDLIDSIAANSEEFVDTPVERLLSILDDPQLASSDHYLGMLELSPTCPLYLGDYLFEDPSSCRNVGTSERNSYMITLRNLYRHFGVEATEKELPDFLPLMVDFANISLKSDARNGTALRRFFLENYLAPGLTLLRAKLDEQKSVYAQVINALVGAVGIDVESMGSVAAWSPPSCDNDGVDSLQGDKGFSCSFGRTEQCASGSGGLPCQEVRS